MFKGVASRPTLPFFGSRPSRLLRIPAIRRPLFGEIEILCGFSSMTPPPFRIWRQSNHIAFISPQT